MARYLLQVSTDATGAGVAQTPTLVSGHVEAVYVDYKAGAAGTTDVTVTTVQPPTRTLVNLVNNTTPTAVYPTQQRTDSAGVVIASQYDRVYLDGETLKVTVAQGSADAAAAVTVIIWIS